MIAHTQHLQKTRDATPDVNRQYDLAINGKDRINQTWQGGTETSATYIDSYDALGRPLIQRQRYETNGVWSVSYQTERAYNLAGLVTWQKYPSGRTVSYTYDDSGRATSFTGYLADNRYRPYSNEITYSPFGGLGKEKYGTTIPIYNKHFYNIRGQLGEIRAGLTYSNPTDGSWERGAIINHYGTENCWGASCNDPNNNGNLRQQDHWINDGSGGVAGLFVQNYDYDALNRLQRVREGTNWQQEYVYDRWGNRTISGAGTWLGNSNAQPDPLLNETQFETANLQSTNRLYAPGDLQLPDNERRMGYDAAGNLATDTYTGAGTGNGNRVYDAENRMIHAWGGNNQWQEYTYDGDGHRVRRKVDGVETWQIYGFDGELLAEYPANGAPGSPQKEYGYRNGQLLVTAAGRTNYALATNGATATASSTYTGIPFSAGAAIDGEHRGLNWLNGGGWHGSTATFPQWLEVTFDGNKTIDEIGVFTVQDNPQNPSEPTGAMTFSLYGLTGYDVQYWNGSSWVTVTGGNVTGNNKVWKRITFAPISTNKIRVVTNASIDNWSRVTELEAWGGASSTNVALATNGATATASSTYTGLPFSAGAAIDGEHRGLNWLNGGGWHGSTATFPQWLEVTFDGNKTIDEIGVFTVQDSPQNPSEPTEAMTFSLYGLTGYDVQYWNGTSWVTCDGWQCHGK